MARPIIENGVCHLTYNRYGTEGFMAPEIKEGSDIQGNLADIYSLGITLYYLCELNLPFETTKPTGIFLNEIKECKIPSITKEPYKTYFNDMYTKMVTKVENRLNSIQLFQYMEDNPTLSQLSDKLLTNPENIKKEENFNTNNFVQQFERLYYKSNFVGCRNLIIQTKSPNNKDNMRSICKAKLKFTNGIYDKALKHLNKIKLDQNSDLVYDFYRIKIETLILQNQFNLNEQEELIATAQKIVEANPLNRKSSYISEALVFFQYFCTDEKKEAIENLEALIKYEEDQNFPENEVGRLYYIIAIFYSKINLFSEKAKEYFKKSLNVLSKRSSNEPNPLYGKACYNYANLLFKQYLFNKKKNPNSTSNSSNIYVLYKKSYENLVIKKTNIVYYVRMMIAKYLFYTQEDNKALDDIVRDLTNHLQCCSDKVLKCQIFNDCAFYMLKKDNGTSLLFLNNAINEYQKIREMNRPNYIKNLQVIQNNYCIVKLFTDSTYDNIINPLKLIQLEEFDFQEMDFYFKYLERLSTLLEKEKKNENILAIQQAMYKFTHTSIQCRIKIELINYFFQMKDMYNADKIVNRLDIKFLEANRLDQLQFSLALGNLYFHFKNYGNALNNYHICCQILQTIKMTKGYLPLAIVYTYYNLSIACISTFQYEKAKKFLSFLKDQLNDKTEDGINSKICDYYNYLST